ELLDRGFLFSGPAAAVRSLLELRQMLLGIVQLGLQLELFGLEPFVGLSAQCIDARELAFGDGAPANRDQAGWTGEIVDRIHEEVAIVGEWTHQGLAQR